MAQKARPSSLVLILIGMPSFLIAPTILCCTLWLTHYFMVFHSETMASPWLPSLILYSMALLFVCLFFRLFLLLFICNDNIDCLIASSFFWWSYCISLINNSFSGGVLRLRGCVDHSPLSGVFVYLFVLLCRIVLYDSISEDIQTCLLIVELCIPASIICRSLVIKVNMKTLGIGSLLLFLSKY